MAIILCMFIALTRVFLATSVGLYQDFVMITDFSNKILKNNPTEVSQISTRSLLECTAQCGRCCRCFGFNKLTKVCRVFKTCDWAGETEYEDGWIYHTIKGEVKPENCQDIFEGGCTTSGIFTIYPCDECDEDLRSIKVFCDMETSDGGWTVLQRRISGSTDFNQSLNAYKKGFGSLKENFWIGNDVIHQLTKNENVTLYVAITLVSGLTKYQIYRRFSVADESDNFRLFLQKPEPNGTLGDSMVNTMYTINSNHGMPFSKYEQYYNASTSVCKSFHSGGWWFNICYQSFLNGPWKNTQWPWYPAVSTGSEIRGTLMMIRPN